MSTAEAKEQKEPKETNLVADPKRTKLVKIRAKQTLIVSATRTLKPGEVAEVPEADAEQFCKTIVGHYDFGGERSVETSTKHNLVRAERV